MKAVKCLCVFLNREDWYVFIIAIRYGISLSKHCNLIKTFMCVELAKQNVIFTSITLFPFNHPIIFTSILILFIQVSNHFVQSHDCIESTNSLIIYKLYCYIFILYSTVYEIQ